METLVAPLVFQSSVALAPGVMAAGLAVNDVIVGVFAVLGPTVTFTEALTDPAPFFAVNV